MAARTATVAITATIARSQSTIVNLPAHSLKILIYCGILKIFAIPKPMPLKIPQTPFTKN